MDNKLMKLVDGAISKIDRKHQNSVIDQYFDV